MRHGKAALVGLNFFVPLHPDSPKVPGAFQPSGRPATGFRA